MSEFVLCDASETALIDSQLSHRAMAQGQSKHMNIIHGDTEGSVTLPMKTIALSGTTHWDFNEMASLS